MTRSRAPLSPSLRTGLWIALGAVLLGTLFSACMIFMPIPKDLDLSTTRSTDNKMYIATITPQSTPIPIGRIHSWTINVKTADGKPVEHATIVLDGDMPQHGHGLPTTPRVTRELGDGSYLVEGMKFSMTGWWTLEFGIKSASGEDNVTYNLVLREEGV